MDIDQKTIQQLLCLVPLLAVGIFVVVMSERDTRRKNKAAAAYQASLEAAQAAYQASLQQLKVAPNNADLKQKTLELGRAYSGLTRQGTGVTIYDEMALGNDISAATAGAMAVGAQPIEARLKKLSELKAQGMISEQEYAARREQILRDV